MSVSAGDVSDDESARVSWIDRKRDSAFGQASVVDVGSATNQSFQTVAKHGCIRKSTDKRMETIFWAQTPLTINIDKRPHLASNFSQQSVYLTIDRKT